MPELRVRITQNELEELQERARGVGDPSITSFVRTLIFPEHDHQKKWQEVKSAIERLEPGATFLIRDLLPNTPPQLGIKAYRLRFDLKIYCIGKPGGINKWRKYTLLTKILVCPHCAAKQVVDIKDDCTVTTEERSMGLGNLYEFDYTSECSSCRRLFKTSGYVSEYPAETLEHEEITVSIPEGGE